MQDSKSSENKQNINIIYRVLWKSVNNIYRSHFKTPDRSQNFQTFAVIIKKVLKSSSALLSWPFGGSLGEMQDIL